MNPPNSNPGLQRLLPAIALVAPVLAVQFFRSVLGAGADVAASNAGQAPMTDPAAAAAIETPTAPVTAEQKRAVAWLASLNRQDPARSPMDHPKVASDTPPPAPSLEPDAPTTKPAPADAPHPKSDITLGAIMGSSRGSLASIGGRIFRVGEQLEAGWTIEAIDPKLQIVTLAGPDKAKIELKNEWKRRNDE